MCEKYQIPRKCCTPVFFACFVCALFSLCARKFLAKSETQEPRKLFCVTHLVCYVYPFLDSYEANRSVPVCPSITAYDYTDNVPPDVCFGDQMNHSMINPNQCQLYSIGLRYDAWDSNCLFQFKDDKGQKLPFEMANSIVKMKTRTLTKEELEN